MPTAGLEYRYPFIGVHVGHPDDRADRASHRAAERDEYRQVAERGRPEPGLRRHQPVQGRQVLRLGPRRRRRSRQRGPAIHRPVQSRRHVNVLFGQSYQLFGMNSFAVGDTTNTGLGSGLDKSESDYVARLAYSAEPDLQLHLSLPLRRADFTLQRFEVEGRANFDRWNVSVMYGNYAAAARARLPRAARRTADRGLVKIDANWSFTARPATISSRNKYQPDAVSASATSTTASCSG